MEVAPNQNLVPVVVRPKLRALCGDPAEQSAGSPPSLRGRELVVTHT